MFSVRQDEKAIEYTQDGQMLGEITWYLQGDTMVMDHTYVSTTLRGQGLPSNYLMKQRIMRVRIIIKCNRYARML